jgi:hypothetical protein
MVFVIISFLLRSDNPWLNYYEKKVSTVIVNNSTNIITEHKKDHELGIHGIHPGFYLFFTRNNLIPTDQLSFQVLFVLLNLLQKQQYSDYQRSVTLFNRLTRKTVV